MPVAELRQIQALLNTLEVRLDHFYQLRTKPDSRRGLMNLGGIVLRTLFGTTTVDDIFPDSPNYWAAGSEWRRRSPLFGKSSYAHHKS
jgi:hypothetical protein